MELFAEMKTSSKDYITEDVKTKKIRATEFSAWLYLGNENKSKRFLW